MVHNILLLSLYSSKGNSLKKFYYKIFLSADQNTAEEYSAVNPAALALSAYEILMTSLSMTQQVDALGLCCSIIA